MIDRRRALQGVIAILGATVYAPIARAATLTAIPNGSQSVSFTAEERALVSALSERIIPTTDTPGAIAAGVPAYIEQFLGEWALPGDFASFRRGLTALNLESRERFGKPAHLVRTDQHDALLTLAMNREIADAGDIFEILRQLVIVGYYTSEIGVTVEREYLPVPGSYDGAYPISKITKIWSY